MNGHRFLLSLALSGFLVACFDEHPAAPALDEGFLTVARNAGGAGALDYSLRETVPLPVGANFLAAGHLDGDAALDVVSWISKGPGFGFWLTERDGGSFVTRFTVSEGSAFRGAFVGNLDGDGFPEIVTGHLSDHKVRIWEASGNDTYVLRYTANVGRKITMLRSGDSDGDGLTELVVGRESFPTQVHFIESQGNNFYVGAGLLTGGGGNLSVAGVRDLNGNGVPDVVFSDDGYSSSNERLYVFESGTQVYYDGAARLDSRSLADTDGNGLIEVVGFDVNTTDTRILENTSAGYGLVEVYHAPGYDWRVIDVDNDGREEFWRVVDNGSGHLNGFMLGHRSGAVITDVYDSGTLLHGSTDAIKRVWAIGDTNGDGGLEVGVQQGGNLHILELVPVDAEGPDVIDVALAPNPAEVDATTAVTATVDDSNTGGSAITSAEYRVDGGVYVPMSAADGSFGSVTEAVTAGLVASSDADVFDICVRGSDAVGNVGDEACAMFVVYDPSGGFVTGGGWINSPLGAYMADPDLEGKAHFGFVSKYKKGARTPTGNTEFRFQAGDLNFHSTTYDWLVVTGNDFARFKGTGTINGAPAPNGEEFLFMIWAGDGEPDTFRIRIWWEDSDGTEHVAYDNGTDRPIGGGSIIVHAK